MRRLAILPFLTLTLACTDGTIVQPEDDLTVAAATQPFNAGKPGITYAGLRGSGCGLAQPWLVWEAFSSTKAAKLLLVFSIWRQDSETPVYVETHTGIQTQSGYHYGVRHQIPVDFGVQYRMTAELFAGQSGRPLDTATTPWVSCPTPPPAS